MNPPRDSHLVLPEWEVERPDLLRTIDDLPPTVREIVASYMDSNRELQGGSFAGGLCWATSEALRKRIAGLSSGWLRPALVDWLWENPKARFSQGPLVPHPHYRQGVIQEEGHTALLVRAGETDFYIDLTARQFDEQSPWPLIWVWDDCLSAQDGDLART